MAPIGSRVALLTPFPRIRSPVDVMGDKALKAPEAVVWPVPPEPTANVPASVTAPVVDVEGVRPVVPAENDATVLAVVASVPVVGSVTAVVPVTVNVVAKAPDVVRFPPSVSVFVPLLTPVPPFAAGRIPVTPVVSGNPVAFVSTKADGVPKAGVVSVGLLLITTDPAVPVIVYSPTVPALSNNTRPDVPPETVEEPTARLLPLGGNKATLTMADGLAGRVGLVAPSVGVWQRMGCAHDLTVPKRGGVSRATSLVRFGRARLVQANCAAPSRV